MPRWLALLLSPLALLLPLVVQGAPVSQRYDVVDLRVHLPYQQMAHGHGLTVGSGQADAVRLRRGGASGVVLPLLGALRGDRSTASLEAQYLAVQRQLARSSELRLPGCQRRGTGISTWLAIEGADSLSPNQVGVWVTRGVRLFGLTRTEDNDLATSSRSPPTLTGLTRRGRSLVQRIHAEGGVVDVSHASDMTVRDVTELAREAGVPVVASHSNARALTNTRRNSSDESLRAIADTGGVVGVTFDRRLLATGHPADLADVVRHVQHVARVAGHDHVAIGSGFEGAIRPPHALLNASRYQRLARALAEAGWSDDSIEKLMSANAQRVLCPAQSR